jgi:hypothetical protein
MCGSRSIIHREDEGVDSPFRVLSWSAKQVMAAVDWALRHSSYCHDSFCLLMVACSSFCRLLLFFCLDPPIIERLQLREWIVIVWWLHNRSRRRQ